jgi:hypothetical protein
MTEFKCNAIAPSLLDKELALFLNAKSLLDKDLALLLNSWRQELFINPFDQYTSDKLKKDREIVLKTVQENYKSLKFAIKELKNDKEILLKAVQQDKIPLKTKQVYKVRDYETKALNKRFHCTKKSQYYNTNALNQRYQKKY